MDKTYENFGYDTGEPCIVCQKKGDNKLESRFGYVVCEKHYKMSPVEISKLEIEE